MKVTKKRLIEHYALKDSIKKYKGYKVKAPEETLNLKKHQQKPISLNEVKEMVFEFHNKDGARIYHSAPCRVFLVHNINGKWLYWGKIVMLEQTISWDGKGHKTSPPSPLCSLPWYKMTILPSGEVKPDCVCPHIAGNILKEDLIEIWNSPVMQLYREKIIKRDTQGFCAPVCNTGSYLGLYLIEDEKK